MSWTNYHSHSLFCDGKADLKDFVLAAIRNGLSAFGFSGHGPVPLQSDWNISNADWPLYVQQVKGLKEKYKDQIDIYTGVEADFIQNRLSAKDAVICDAELDFVIGSLHYLGELPNGAAWTVDGPPAEWEAGLNQIYGGEVFNIVKEFSRQSIEMMEKGGMEIIGHMDKTFQHGHKYFEVDDARNVGYVCDMLKAAKENDLIVEVNTKSYRGLGFFYPHQYFFKQLKEWNIPITINADAHHPELLTASFKDVAQILLEVGIHETVELVQGDWALCKLTKNGIVFPSN